MKTFRQLISEIDEQFVAEDAWEDHSWKYSTKKGEKKSTLAHPDGKHILHVIHNKSGVEIGTIHPYSASDDKKKPGARIVSSRKHVTRYGFNLHQGHGPESHRIPMYTKMGHTSPKSALAAMAGEHQKHLQKQDAHKNEQVTESRGHGSPYDRGAADSYYGRLANPHKKHPTTGVKSHDLSDDEKKEYHRGYNDNEEKGDRWNHD